MEKYYILDSVILPEVLDKVIEARTLLQKMCIRDRSTAYELTFVDSLSVYIQYCSSYFAFAFIAYGIGNLIHRVSFLNNTLADMMSDAAKEQETEEKVSTEE